MRGALAVMGGCLVSISFGKHYRALQWLSIDMYGVCTCNQLSSRCYPSLACWHPCCWWWESKRSRGCCFSLGRSFMQVPGGDSGDSIAVSSSGISINIVASLPADLSCKFLLTITAISGPWLVHLRKMQMENHMIKPAYYLKQLPCSSHGIIKSTVLLQRGVITIVRFGFRKIPCCAITPLYKPGIIGAVLSPV